MSRWPVATVAALLLGAGFTRNSIRGRRRSAWLCLGLLAAACSARPVPYLERAMGSFEAEHERARGLSDRNAKTQAYRALRDEVATFRAALDDERELDPNAKIQASSDYAGGIGWVRVDRRDVASIRARADRLLRSLNRYLRIAAPS